MKYIILDFWHKHDTGTTFCIALSSFTIGQTVGMIGMLSHIAYTWHKHYLLIKTTNMAKKSEVSDKENKEAENKNATPEDGKQGPAHAYSPVGTLGGVRKPFHGFEQPVKDEKK